jgi:hypothetical protein
MKLEQPTLEQLQAAFMQELQGLEQPALRRQIVARGMSPARRLAIYRGNGIGACSKALELIYPVCRTIVGEAYFRQLALQYIEAYPSRQSDLNAYGGYWPDFLQRLVAADTALGELSYLADLARLEWHYHAAYYADNDPGFDFVALQQVPPSRQNDIYWHCSVALTVMQSAHPLYAVWHGNRDGRTVGSVAGLSEPECLCIYRSGFELVVEVINSSSYALLRGVLDGKTMGQLLAEEWATDINLLLPQWVQRGWLCGFSLAPPAEELQ